MSPAFPPSSAYEYQIPQNESYFDLTKMQQTYQTYHENHPGLTLAIGHPFENEDFLRSILEEQQLIKNIFQYYRLDQYLNLYEPEQIHATVIELASQHDESQIDQQTLSEHELTASKKGTDININFAAEWMNKTKPFDVELGLDVLSEEHKDQTIRITSKCTKQWTFQLSEEPAIKDLARLYKLFVALDAIFWSRITCKFSCRP